MFGATYTSILGVLTPSKALRLFNLYMESTRRKDNDHNILMEPCLDANFALPRIKRSETNNLVSPTFNGDKVLCQSITSAYNETARLFESSKIGVDPKESNLIHRESSQVGGSINSNNNNQDINGNSNISLKEMIKGLGNATTNSIAIVPTARVLLLIAPQPSVNLTKDVLWPDQMTTMSKSELATLLASNVITMFIHDDIKTEATVVEVIMLTPVLDYDQYRVLFMALVNEVIQDVFVAHGQQSSDGSKMRIAP
ncbi:hypothetical protein BX616_008698 [Lobosporangium transversale]|nr:hypothetical protein BX616_008698 [Lobosporangium transversale]